MTPPNPRNQTMTTAGARTPSTAAPTDPNQAGLASLPLGSLSTNLEKEEEEFLDFLFEKEAATKPKSPPTFKNSGIYQLPADAYRTVKGESIEDELIQTLDVANLPTPDEMMENMSNLPTRSLFVAAGEAALKGNLAAAKDAEGSFLANIEKDQSLIARLSNQDIPEREQALVVLKEQRDQALAQLQAAQRRYDGLCADVERDEEHLSTQNSILAKSPEERKKIRRRKGEDLIQKATKDEIAQAFSTTPSQDQFIPTLYQIIKDRKNDTTTDNDNSNETSGP